MAADEEEPWTWDKVHQEINLIEKHFHAAQEAIRAQHELDSDAAHKKMQDRSRQWYARNDVPPDARAEIFDLLQDRRDERIKRLDELLEKDLYDLEQKKNHESSKTWIKLHRGSGSRRTQPAAVDNVASRTALPDDRAKASDNGSRHLGQELPTQTPPTPATSTHEAPAQDAPDHSTQGQTAQHESNQDEGTQDHQSTQDQATQDQDTQMQDAPSGLGTTASGVPLEAPPAAASETLHQSADHPTPAEESTKTPKPDPSFQGQTPSNKDTKRKLDTPHTQNGDGPAKKSKYKHEVPDGPPLTDRTISFEEVYQNGNALYKHTIVKYGQHWYILKCDEHGVHFRQEAVIAAAKHLDSEPHGNQKRFHDNAIKKLGFLVTGCNDELAERHNTLVNDAFAKGYRPLNSFLRKKPRQSGADISFTQQAETSTPSKPRAPVPPNPTSKKSKDVITDPVSGELYLGSAKPKFPGDKPKKYIVMVLAWKELDVCGRIGETLGASPLLQDATRKTCYTYDQDGITGWAQGYEDGGPYVRKRWFPIVWFEDRSDKLGWIRAEELKPFTPSPAVRGPYHPETRARTLYAQGRSILEGDKSVQPQRPQQAVDPPLPVKEDGDDADIDTSTDEDSIPEETPVWTEPPIVIDDDSDDTDYVGDAVNKASDPPRRSTQEVRPSTRSGARTASAEVVTPRRIGAAAGTRSTSKKTTEASPPSRRSSTIPPPAVELGSPIMETKTSKSRSDRGHKPLEEPQQQSAQQSDRPVEAEKQPAQQAVKEVAQQLDKGSAEQAGQRPAENPEQFLAQQADKQPENPQKQQTAQKKSDNVVPQPEQPLTQQSKQQLEKPEQQSTQKSQQRSAENVAQPPPQKSQQQSEKDLKQQPVRQSEQPTYPLDRRLAQQQPEQQVADQSNQPPAQEPEQRYAQDAKQRGEQQAKQTSRDIGQRPVETVRPPQDNHQRHSTEKQVEGARPEPQKGIQQPPQHQLPPRPQPSPQHQLPPRPPQHSQSPQPPQPPQPHQFPPPQQSSRGPRQVYEQSRLPPKPKPVERPFHRPTPEEVREQHNRGLHARYQEVVQPGQPHNQQQAPLPAQPSQPQQATMSTGPELLRATTSKESHPVLRNGTSLTTTNTRQGRISPIAELLNPEPRRATGMLAAQELARQALQHGQHKTQTNGHSGTSFTGNPASANVNVAPPPAEDRWRVVRNTPAASPEQSSRTGSPAKVKHDPETFVKGEFHIDGYKEGNGAWRIFTEPVQLIATDNGIASGGTVTFNAHQAVAVQFNKDPVQNNCEVIIWSDNNSESKQHFLFNGSGMKGLRFQRWMKSIKPTVTQMSSQDSISV